ncbi:response regulator transcription factor [Siccirubricoccus sp. KC 17139]|uniref:Response regulator transcription factor n=1 Tax=Siccirubricoccus soli TaxID=2899147 RepID=A0ABT1D0J2_9PROT|nr:response regulator transcription factor [Siccirubricoccus soli]MCO6415430.1 response regulator transcription factor [Siccirubricoccus soli]MCP2681562.1 response regulator transcription factor [Siccirubricoccus soli]
MRILLAADTADTEALEQGLARLGVLADPVEGFEDLASVITLSGPYELVLLVVRGTLGAAQEAVRALRRSGQTLPLLVLAQGGADAAAEQAMLHAGADDLVRPPIHLAVLQARMQAMARRARGFASAALTCGNVTLDQEQHAVWVDGSRVPLTAREYDFLETLMRHKGVLLTKERFMASLYAEAEAPDSKIVDVFVCKLRRKLAASGAAEIIRTVWGRGYVLFEPSAEAVAEIRAQRREVQAAPARGWVRRTTRYATA